MVIARCLEQGHGSAQKCATKLIADWNPKWILVVGIAGGIPAEEYSLGDVMLANRVYDFSVTAAVDGKKSELNPTGGPVHPSVEKLLQIIRACESKLGSWNGADAIPQPKPPVSVGNSAGKSPFFGDAEWQKKVRKCFKANFPRKETPRAPIFTVGAIVTANVLVKDPETAQEWLKAARAISHIDMELGGVMRAAEDRPVLSVRGLSDIVGYRRSSAWTGFACQSAAAFAHALIRSGLVQLEPEAMPE